MGLQVLDHSPNIGPVADESTKVPAVLAANEHDESLAGLPAGRQTYAQVLAANGADG